MKFPTWRSPFEQIDNKKTKTMKSSLSTVMLWFIIVSMLINSVLAQESSNVILSKMNCPSPLIIKQSDFLNDTSQICFNDCCLPCPFVNNFYGENKIKNTYENFAIVGIISFFLMILLVVFFVKLPSQKQNPISKQILLPLAISVMWFEGSEFFTLFQQKTQVNKL